MGGTKREKTERGGAATGGVGGERGGLIRPNKQIQRRKREGNGPNEYTDRGYTGREGGGGQNLSNNTSISDQRRLRCVRDSVNVSQCCR